MNSSVIGYLSAGGIVYKCPPTGKILISCENISCHDCPYTLVDRCHSALNETLDSITKDRQYATFAAIYPENDI